MQKITFKIRKLNSKGEKVIDIRPIILSYPSEEIGKPIYEGCTCYIPEKFVESNKLKHYRVYFWRNSGYWEYINNCTIEDFEYYVMPRILKNTKLLSNG